jgi:hypothetical protein
MTEKKALELVKKDGLALKYVPCELRGAVEAAVKMRRGEA